MSTSHLFTELVAETAGANLEARELSLGYGDTTIVKELSLRIPRGKVTAIVGPNGCGKSTLLAGLSRLHKPSHGAVLLNGKAIAGMSSREVARQLALLPQEATAPDGLTVSELIQFGRQPHQGVLRQWSRQDHDIVRDALAATNLVDLADRPLESMSGGQRQRAWIAMAIAQATPLLLLDEPTSALDLGHQIEVFELIRELAGSGKTIVMVVHDLTSACRYADHIVAMLDGAIIAQGAPLDVVTSELVERLYGVSCVLIRDPRSGTPLIAGIERAAQPGSGR
ncbi:ABC transporter ATP-binding protein [Parapusillimonas granuli]|uniref:ABC transporter ATP-binding protein n=1 Tax=Parapusillimonas granuli TaxID=380911 RepID=A0A853G140_9BURK|nr:ABC transporter ATP-binding protein [Parapusillimonas granuli]MBB5214822.1 iron complex transport system ATP-binding protein [Parapusillimonas granuli]MEB2397930.1 ABC transporter ATP-binding protein [Alcaligenaceae bacterium]NYT48770.1 ABC transporter ATP-binding protein [Parapusillimonas granuli]